MPLASWTCYWTLLRMGGWDVTFCVVSSAPDVSNWMPLFTDLLGRVCARAYREYRHLCHHPRIFLGLWQQRRLQLAAVVKGRSENYPQASCHAVAIHTNERMGNKRSSVASLLSILDAPFDVVRSECTTVADRVSTFLWSGEMIDFIFTYGMFLGALLV